MGHFLRDVHKSSKDLFRNCSSTNLKRSITVLGNIVIFFLELYLNKSFDLGKSNCRTKLSHLTFYICPINILEHIKKSFRAVLDHSSRKFYNFSRIVLGHFALLWLSFNIKSGEYSGSL